MSKINKQSRAYKVKEKVKCERCGKKGRDVRMRKGERICNNCRMDWLAKHPQY